MQNPPLYFLPGLGADKRIFSFLKLNSDTQEHIPYILPESSRESIQSYASRLIKNYIKHPNPILIGVSMGGVLALEIAEQIEVPLVILISSIKHPDEKPTLFRLSEKTGFYRLVPPGLIKNIPWFIQPIFGKMNSQIYTSFVDMIRSTDNRIIRWGVHTIVNWQFEKSRTKVLHIHGTADRLMPARFISDAKWIENGSHVMVGTKARPISKMVNEAIQEIYVT